MIKRNSYLKTFTLSIFLLVSSGLFTACKKETKSLRFGIITDLHYADRENIGNRHCSQSIKKLKEAMTVFKNDSLDFIIELGDFKDQGKIPNRNESLHFLDAIEEIFQSSPLPAYHVLGNHDMDCISKKDFLSHTNNSGAAKGKNYYAFKVHGIKCIVLDANYNKDGSDYDKGNFDWTYASIPDTQRNWLAQELKDGDEPILIFIHQLLNEKTDPLVRVHNAKEIRLLLTQSNRVLAVFQGHHHVGGYEKEDSIHYLTIPGAIEGAYPENNSYAIVELSPSGDISIDGYSKCPDRTLKKELH